MKWRKWNNIIHRDLGYLCVGLSLIYAISGFVVNHTHHWNPNYHIATTTHSIKPVAPGTEITKDVIDAILAELGERSDYNDTFLPAKGKLQIFYDGCTITVNLQSGKAVKEVITERKIIRPMNLLHLNAPKKLWTWVADFYAISLAILAITGLFVLKGRNGLAGRGKWWTAAGIVLPIIFIIWYL